MQPIERPNESRRASSAGASATPFNSSSAEIVAFEGLNISWKDGLPADRTEDVLNEVGLITAGLTSKYSSVKRLNDGDEDATQKELDRIEEEAQKSMEDQMALQAAGQVPGGPEAVDQTTAIVGSMRVNKEKAKETGQDEKPK